VLIYLNIRRRSRGLMAASSLSAAMTSSVAGSADDSQTTAKAKKLLSRDKKSARSLAILIVVFLFTWAPFEVCAFVQPVCSFCIPNFTLEVVFWQLRGFDEMNIDDGAMNIDEYGAFWLFHTGSGVLAALSLRR